MNTNENNSLLQLNLNAADSFFKSFQHHFSAKMFDRFTISVLALLLEHSRACFSSFADKAHIPYQKLQYFISDSKWDPLDSINHTRLEFLYSRKCTAPSKNGVIVIDDTANPKPFSKKLRLSHTSIAIR